MKLALRGTIAVVALGGMALLPGEARAQGPGSGSLGGYGAASSYASLGMGGGGSGPMDHGFDIQSRFAR